MSNNIVSETYAEENQHSIITHSFVDQNNISETFEEIHKNWKWLNKDPERETTCWKGSKLSNNIELLTSLPEILNKYWINEIIDIWCWDINWISMLFDYFIQNNIKYTWLDVSKTIINKAKNKISYQSELINLNVWSIMDLIPSWNKQNKIILAKDILVHLPNNTASDIINESRNHTELLLATNFPETWNNADINLWEWRPTNLNEQPFNTWSIIQTISNSDNSTKHIFPDKNMSLFQLNK